MPDSKEMTTSNYSLRGLRRPAEVLVDRHGVPHIYAGSDLDAFFLQGFNAARDRLWQMDFWRRRGLGMLSEVFGAGCLEHDRAARLFLYRKDMGEEWDSYGPRTREIVSSFVAGINEYVELAERDPSLLPVEFELMDYSPSRWSPEDVVRIRSHGLYGNLRSEIRRAILVRQHGREAESFRRRLEPDRDISIPDGLDPGLISEEILKVYDLATQPIEFDAPRGGGNGGSAQRMEGSNNWVVSPERTATGRPILANDPHRAQTVPSLRYAAHLVSPGMNVIGAGEPSLPGISIGHNEKIAFGLTIFSIDQEDLFVYETNPEKPDEYRYKNGWEEMRVERQRIPVRGSSPEEATLKSTRHGPVIHEEPGVAFVVRAAWLEPGMAPYLGSLGYMGASSWEEFSGAMRNWGSPGENQVYADTDGNIGWHAGGRVPVRPNWDGLLPVPGDGRYEWDGFLEASNLPSELNPSRGWISSANEMNLPSDYPEEKKMSFEWYEPHRARRIEEVLSGSDRSTVEDSLSLQTDYLSIPARQLVPLLSDIQSEDPATNHALELLRNWDCRLTPDSSAATLFEFWCGSELRRAVLDRVLSREARKHILTDDATGDSRPILELLRHPDERLGDSPERTRDDLLMRSLEESVSRLTKLFGTDPASWRWGGVHRISLSHPLSPLVGEAARRKLDLPSLPRGGSGDTVGNTAYERGTFRQISGASWRMVVDVGEWDGSLAMNSPGQSGDPESPHYGDLYPDWAGDKAFPLLYGRERVKANVEHRILLYPAK